MRIAYLDCFSGISGDMFLGALVDAGVSPDLLQRTVRALNVGAEIEISRVMRNGIGATKVDVVVDGQKDMPRDEFWESRGFHSHAHDHEHRHADGTVHAHPHTHEHSHEHTNDNNDEHDHKHGHEHRGLKEIGKIIGSAPIPESAKETAMRIFRALGEAEAKIHNTEIEDVHFHEVGAVDAIVDIVCAAVGAEALAVDEWRCSPLNVGSGMVHCAHGTLPVPAPATLELLRDAPVYSSDIKKELVTPTGAAIVRTLASGFGPLPLLRVEAAGYGAGSRDLPGQANVLRITVGDTSYREPRGDGGELVTILETNIDDSTPQVFGFLMERLFEAGALDVIGIPVQMKKNRPGTLLTVLARPADAKRLSDLIFSESTTIGLRMREEYRLVLERELTSVETEWGKVHIKIARFNGEEMNAAPEFEDCRLIALKHEVPLKRVMQEAMRLYLDEKQDSRVGT